MRLDLIWKDLVIAARNARRRPGFALLVISTLGVGLGVNAAIFALVDSVLLRPLPYRDPGRLVFLYQTLPQHGVYDVEPTPADYTAWHHLKSFSALAMVATETHTLADDGEPERVRGARITASLMPLLGIAALRGRVFEPSEDESGASPVAVLSAGLWRRRYGADPAVIGRSIVIDGTPHQVVGVMPESAVLPGSPAASSDLWLPMRMSPEERTSEISHNYTIVARLADGVSVARATSELAVYPTASAFRRPAASGPTGARAVALADATVRQIRPALIALVAGVIALLLAATANVATLLMSRALARTHDVVIRTALGASRARLLRHTIVETLGLSALGASTGLGIGSVLLKFLLPLYDASLPHTTVPPHVDARVAGVTFTLAALLGILFGAVAVRRTGDAIVANALRAGTRASASAGAVRACSALVIAQVALAVVLLAIAGLLVRSLEHLSDVNPGFAADHLLTFRLALDSGTYVVAENRAAFAAELTREIASRPGVQKVALSSRIPFGGARGASLVDIGGRTPQPGELPIIDQRHITPDYFEAMHVPLLAGRRFTIADGKTGEPVAVINRTMAERYWPGETPLNQRVRLVSGFDSGRWIRIVGVVDNVRHLGLARAPVPEMYRPYAQAPTAEFTVVVRTAGAPTGATGICRSVVHALDRNLPIYDLRTMDDRLAASFAQTRATTILLAVTAVLAAIVAAIAIYGSNWFAVAQRTSEIAIRLALGATPITIYAGVIGGAIRQTAAGTLLGGVVLAGARPVFSTLLFETRVADPRTIGGVGVAIAAITLAAALGPAHRAVRVDPLDALRCE